MAGMRKPTPNRAPRPLVSHFRNRRRSGGGGMGCSLMGLLQSAVGRLGRQAAQDGGHGAQHASTGLLQGCVEGGAGGQAMAAAAEALGYLAHVDARARAETHFNSAPRLLP